MRRFTRFSRRGLGDLLAGAIVLIVAILVIAMMLGFMYRQSASASSPPQPAPSIVGFGGNPASGTGFIIISHASIAACSLMSGGDQYVINCVPKPSQGLLNVTKIIVRSPGTLNLGTGSYVVPISIQPPSVQISVQPEVNYTDPNAATEFAVTVYVANNYTGYELLGGGWVSLTLAESSSSGSSTVSLPLRGVLQPSGVLVYTVIMKVAAASTAGLQGVQFQVTASIPGETVTAAKATAYLVVQG